MAKGSKAPAKRESEPSVQSTRALVEALAMGGPVAEDQPLPGDVRSRYGIGAATSAEKEYSGIAPGEVAQTLNQVVGVGEAHAPDMGLMTMEDRRALKREEEAAVVTAMATGKPSKAKAATSLPKAKAKALYRLDNDESILPQPKTRGFELEPPNTDYLEGEVGSRTLHATKKDLEEEVLDLAWEDHRKLNKLVSLSVSRPTGLTPEGTHLRPLAWRVGMGSDLDQDEWMRENAPKTRRLILEQAKRDMPGGVAKGRHSLDQIPRGFLSANDLWSDSELINRTFEQETGKSMTILGPVNKPHWAWSASVTADPNAIEIGKQVREMYGLYGGKQEFIDDLPSIKEAIDDELQHHLTEAEARVEILEWATAARKRIKHQLGDGTKDSLLWHQYVNAQAAALIDRIQRPEQRPGGRWYTESSTYPGHGWEDEKIRRYLEDVGRLDLVTPAEALAVTALAPAAAMHRIATDANAFAGQLTALHRFHQRPLKASDLNAGAIQRLMGRPEVAKSLHQKKVISPDLYKEISSMDVHTAPEMQRILNKHDHLLD